MQQALAEIVIMVSDASFRVEQGWIRCDRLAASD